MTHSEHSITERILFLADSTDAVIVTRFWFVEGGFRIEFAASISFNIKLG